MGFLGFVGILLAFAAIYIADIKGSRRRLTIFMMLLVMHTVASFAYFFYAEVAGSDAQFYYYDRLQIYGVQTGLGTIFIVNFVQFIKQNFGGSFLDHFMVFNAIGFWGTVFLFKSVNEIFADVEARQPSWSYLPLFLPGLHFWTGAIGKDAPLFLAVSLSVWSAMRINRRLPALGIAVAIMLAVRPHVAVIALMALGVSAIFERRVKLWIKTLLVVSVVGSAVMFANSVETTYRLDVSSAESMSEFLAARGSVSEESGADFSITEGSMPMKVFSLWLRPFFFDSENAMAYVASAENAALLIIFLYLLWNIRLVAQLFKKVLYVRFSVIVFLALTALLAAVNFNVGLGLRQKMMAMPCLLAMLTTLIALRFSRLARARDEEAFDYRVPVAAHSVGSQPHLPPTPLAGGR